MCLRVCFFFFLVLFIKSKICVCMVWIPVRNVFMYERESTCMFAYKTHLPTKHSSADNSRVTHGFKATNQNQTPPPPPKKKCLYVPDFVTFQSVPECQIKWGLIMYFQVSSQCLWAYKWDRVKIVFIKQIMLTSCWERNVNFSWKVTIFCIIQSVMSSILQFLNL